MNDIAAIIVGVMVFTFMVFRNEWLANLLDQRKQAQKGAAETESSDEGSSPRASSILFKAALSGLAGFVATKFLIIPLATGAFAFGGISEDAIEGIAGTIGFACFVIGLLGGGDLGVGCSTGCLGLIISYVALLLIVNVLIPLTGWTTTNVAAPGGALIVAVAAAYGCFVGVLTVYRTVKQDVHR